jgi:hypothetical protein
MRLSLRSAVAGVATLAVSGTLLAAGVTSASAATGPSFEPNSTYETGTITFYDATGNVVTSGDATRSDWYSYAVGSGQPDVTDTQHRGQLYGYLPQAGVDPGNWSGQTISSNVVYPIAGSPAPVSSATTPATKSNAVVANDLTLAQLAANFPNTSTDPGYANFYQLRLRTKNAALYNVAVVQVVGSTWTQVYPAPAAQATATSTALTASPNAGTEPLSTTLTATVSPAGAAGAVQFSQNGAALGAPVAVNASGVATKAVSGLAAGSFSFTAAFAPTDATAYKPSTSGAVTVQVNRNVPTPTVALTSDKATANVGDPVTFTANVSPSTAAGTVEFFDGTTSLGAATAASAGQATLTTSTLANGAHNVTAKFVPTDATAFNPATSPVVTVSVVSGACAQTGSQCTDAQAFQATVPVGTLVISTPYTASSPFDLGTLKLSTDATMLSTGPVAFGAGTDGKGVTITDGRSGNLPWTASLQSSAFVSGSDQINGRNLGFTDVAPQYVGGNALSATNPVTVTQNPASAPAVAPADTTTTTGLGTVKQFAHADKGAGSVYVTGSFTLNAPTSTPAGLYKGTVTFTIS